MFNKNPDSFDVETATVEVMRNMELYGASSMDGETDQHYMPDTTILQGVIVEMFSNLSTVVEDNCLETETDDLHWNIVNISNHKINRLERAFDQMNRQFHTQMREQNGTEIKSEQLEQLTDKSKRTSGTIAYFATMPLGSIPSMPVNADASPEF